MTYRLAPLAVAALAVGVAAAAIALLARSPERTGGVQGVVARTSLAPAAGLFGDSISAEVDVALDPRTVDPDSVLLATDFGAFDAPAIVVPRRADAGGTVRLRYRYTLVCLREACRPRGRARAVTLAPVAVRYRLRDGTARRRRLGWPAPLVIGSRLSASDAGRPVFRVREHPLPQVSYAVRPGVAAGLGYGAAALLALAALAVLAAEVRTLLARREPDPFAGLTPLERALALLARAVADGSPAQQRRALDRLARELRHGGESELAADARRLAWSRTRPERSAVAALAAAAAAARGTA